MTVHIGTLGEIPTTALKAPSPHRRAPNWGAFLARPIPLADGERVLERLWDAADVLHAEAGESPDAAEKALIAAAQSGETLLYRVTDAGFAPMQMEVSAR